MKDSVFPPIVYKEIQPHAHLRPLVSCYWQFEYFPKETSKPLDHSVLPDGCTSLVFIKVPSIPQPLLVFTGPRTDLFKTRVDPNSVFIGIRFQPAAFEPIFGLSPQNIRGQTVPAFPYLKNLDTRSVFSHLERGFSKFDLLDQLLQHFLSQHPPAIDQQIDQAIKTALANEGKIQVNTLAETVHLSIRQFQRRFKKATGLTPKEFLKIRRLRSSAIQLLLEQKDYQDVLFQSGYFDQAHFNHDFATIAGTNPTLFGTYIAKIEHEGL